MEADPVTVSPNLTIDTFAAQLIDGESPMTAVPVMEGDEVVGILGVAQVRRIPRARWTTTRVEEAMVKPPKMTFLSREEALKDALEQIQRRGLDGLPVMEDDKLVGVLTRRSASLFVRSKQAGAAGTGSGAASSRRSRLDRRRVDRTPEARPAQGGPPTPRAPRRARAPARDGRGRSAAHGRGGTRRDPGRGPRPAAGGRRCQSTRRWGACWLGPSSRP